MTNKIKIKIESESIKNTERVDPNGQMKGRNSTHQDRRTRRNRTRREQNRRAINDFN